MVKLRVVNQMVNLISKIKRIVEKGVIFLLEIIGLIVVIWAVVYYLNNMTP